MPRVLAVTLLAVVLAPAATRAVEPEQIARAVSVQGTVEAQRAGQPDWAPVKLDEAFSAGDTIRVGARSRADLILLDRSLLRLAESTSVVVRPPKPERTGVLDLLRGAVHFLSRGPRSLDVKTELVAVGVRGTEFLVVAEADSTAVTVLEGTVLAENPQGSLTLTSGQSAVARRGEGPVLQAVARPRDAVRWALHYPPVLYPRPEGFAADPAVAEALRQSIAAYRQGDLTKALEAIADVPPSVTDPRFLAYRAQLLLAVGRTDEAGADLERALAASPDDAAALSLPTIVAVVLAERDRALALARRAVEVAPESATAHLALSYAEQARFDLRAARSSAERAVRLDPEDALAWARLAELHASFADRGASLEAARRAAALAPDLSRTQTVLGFAHLAEVRPGEARKAFERAIALDSADPLPRLGLGLARIRQGDLDAGARELEIAASLGPNDAIVRSYLGKAYYEEKRAGLDEREFETAKALDPRDPTPWFYGAIAKQTRNRPVEALHDLEHAIELNDGRAVYRSRLLLDADLAARSASLARVYGDLGFQQLALVEGWKSVAADPASDSAHRFLADSYAALPRHEVARVSELLQAQLLQPLNLTPIQPRLAESNLFLISAAGPGSLSFNEFNPLFVRDRLALQLNGIAGEGSTTGVEPIVSGVWRKLSFSAGYTRFETDGFRTNNDQKDEIANAFVQAELTSRTSVQAEYRHRESDRGDLRSRFFPEEIRPPLRETSESDTFRLGGRYSLAPGSILLASAMYREDTGGFVDRDIDPVLQRLAADFDGRGIAGELQHLFRARFVDLVTGAGFFRIESSNRLTQTLALPPPPFGPGTIEVSQDVDRDARHGNAYAYAYVRLPQGLTATLGASGDLVRSDAQDDRKRLNPKMGMTWSLPSRTTLRAAAFRVLRRTLLTDQTLEPTQVAGFNQLFDDPDGTSAWRYGVGVDQKISRDLFAGVEGTRRDLDVPVQLVSGGTVERTETSWREYLARGYLFWTPQRWLAFRAEYSFERLDRVAALGAFGVEDARTHRVPLGISFFHGSGLGASATATYFSQRGSFGDAPPFRFGSDRFWVVDGELKWRLPRRYGSVGVVATNVLDEEFRLFENGLNNWNSTVQPSRAVFARLTLAVP